MGTMGATRQPLREQVGLLPRATFVEEGAEAGGPCRMGGSILVSYDSQYPAWRRMSNSRIEENLNQLPPSTIYLSLSAWYRER
eukprot:scaffold91036_cov27-Tisochrysis_lutea.AAC.1